MKKWDYKIKINDSWCEWTYDIKTDCEDFSIEDLAKVVIKKLKGELIKRKCTKKYKITQELFNKA